MRAILIVLSLVAVASAQYNYQIGNDGGVSGGQLGGGFTKSGAPVGSNNDLSNSFANNADGSPLERSFSNEGIDNGEPSFASDESAPANQFITYTVDENDFKDKNADRVLQSVKKPTRVVFIKGPSNKHLEDAILSLGQKTPQTAIYILNKQPDLHELANKLNSINENRNNRPEVHFVKYRTPEDALNAQNTIQEQYNALGGTSKAFDGGFASSLNFASQAPIRAPSAVSVPENSYLPASILRLFRL
ncbi:uncharacterized protein LOC101897137 [Musca domestica]|uniref:Uncharacterized protein LOC101897137 n=1 Tax=Musca domestica TaxID=7370 RepID=A0A9J7I6W5_MUSDO|nr:uncharacterized protein LOC101897137 [Musca domestica]